MRPAKGGTTGHPVIKRPPPLRTSAITNPFIVGAPGEPAPTNWVTWPAVSPALVKMTQGDRGPLGLPGRKQDSDVRAGKLCDMVAPNSTQSNQNAAGHTAHRSQSSSPGTWSLAAWSLDLENMNSQRSRGTGHHLGGHTCPRCPQAFLYWGPHRNQQLSSHTHAHTHVHKYVTKRSLVLLFTKASVGCRRKSFL